MQTIRIIFTKRTWNIGSWLIRWAMPRSRFALALSSHCLIVDGDHIIEANMFGGVQRVLLADAMVPLMLVRTVDYVVPDADAAIAWARSQCGKKYDFKGAFGLSLAPDRRWNEDDAWYCYEFAAGALAAGGRDAFADHGHISESTLLMLKP